MVMVCPVVNPAVLATVYVAREPVPVMPVIETGVTVTVQLPRPVVAVPPVPDPAVITFATVKVVADGMVAIVEVPLPFA